jgi:hypothetical protein
VDYSDNCEENVIKRQFEDLHSLLNKVTARYFPLYNELDLGPIKRPDRNLFDSLLFLSQIGFDTVNHNRIFFLSHHLYEDGMYWSHLFKLIDSSCWQYGEKGENIPSIQDTIQRLAVIIIDMLEYSTARPGDITDSNKEAIESILSVFYSRDLINTAISRIAELQDSHKIASHSELMVSQIVVRSLENALCVLQERINKLKRKAEDSK